MDVIIEDEEKSKGDALLLACNLGNITETKEIMGGSDPPSLHHADESGRTALTIALEKNDIDVMEFLIGFADDKLQASTLLDAISERNEQIACCILRNIQHGSLGDNLMKELESGGMGMGNSAVANADVTPMMLAAERNLYQVVASLHDIGQTIAVPHSYHCMCEECVTQATVDQLRFAQRRLNAYKALASESYLSIVSTDPIQDAFRLSAEMKEMSKVEKHFKNEYLSLAEQISEYLVKLLDRVREQVELEKILNHVDKGEAEGEDEEEEPLARIQKAVNHEEKQFVAHPSCQMKLVDMWYQGAGYLEKGSMFNRVLYFLATVAIHPFLVPVYILWPNNRFVSFMSAPVVKFIAQTSWFIAFLAVIISWSLNTSDVNPHKLDLEPYPSLFPLFKEDAEHSGYYIVRRSSVSSEEILITVWVLGFLMVEVTQLYYSGYKDYFNSLYNVLDIVMIALYCMSLTLRFTILNKVSKSLAYFDLPRSLRDLSDGDYEARLNYYWINADRMYWNSADPHHVAEAVFAVANVLTFSRVSYLLPVSETLGPLQISLGRMLYDVSRFTILFVLVSFAFLIGLNNQFWYYSDGNRVEVELTDHGPTSAGASYGSFSSAFYSVFWGIFGMTDQLSTSVEAYEATFTQGVGTLIYGMYMVSTVIVLLNMLIAMMSESFNQIEEESDVEWKFARSKLYLEFIDEDSPLPAPMNLIQIIIAPIAAMMYVCKNARSIKQSMVDSLYSVRAFVLVMFRCTPSSCCKIKDGGQIEDNGSRNSGQCSPFNTECTMHRPSCCIFHRNGKVITEIDYNNEQNAQENADDNEGCGSRLLDVCVMCCGIHKTGQIIEDDSGLPEESSNIEGDVGGNPECSNADDMEIRVISESGQEDDIAGSLAITYKEVITRVVTRFIYDVTSGDEGEGEQAKDEVGDVRQDVTRMRREVINAITVQENAIKVMRSTLFRFMEDIGTRVEDNEKKLEECAHNISTLRSTVDNLQHNQEESFQMYITTTERINESIEIMTTHIVNIPDESLQEVRKAAPATRVMELVGFFSNKPS